MRRLGVVVFVAVVSVGGVVRADNVGPPVLLVWDCSDEGDWPGADHGFLEILSPTAEVVASTDLGSETSTEFDTWDDHSFDPGVGYQWVVRCHTLAEEDLGINNSGYFDLLGADVSSLGAPSDEIVEWATSGAPLPGVVALFFVLLLLSVGVRFARRATGRL